MIPESILERLRKIEALARSGKWGEQENAQNLLNALLKKYNLTLDDLTSEKTTVCKFSYQDKEEELLLVQVVLHITRNRELRGRKGRGNWTIALTPTQAIDARECYAHYRKEWKKECKQFMEAFIHKNRIYGPIEGGASPMAPDDVRRIAELMRRMTGNRWEKTDKLNNKEVISLT